MAFRPGSRSSIDCGEMIALNIRPEELLDVATASAEEAGKKLLRLFRSSKRLSIRRKYDYPGSVVTNADIESERIILGKIRRSRIKSIVNSEEAGTINYGSRDIIWALDPLDGTLNYVKRIPYFAVSIGVLLNGETVAGAIYNPVLDEMHTACRGRGAYLNGKRIHVSNTRSLKNSALIFEWWNKEHLIPDPLELEKRLYHFTRSIRSPGSVALNLCSVASGRFDGLVTVFRRSPIYETAAGCLILEEASGRITNSSGESWKRFSDSILAGGPRIHGQLLSVVRRL
jgi:myo-inositol-1(or 4)-monophosphatase